jgi:hypothetical protein
MFVVSGGPHLNIGWFTSGAHHVVHDGYAQVNNSWLMCQDARQQFWEARAFFLLSHAGHMVIY